MFKRFWEKYLKALEIHPVKTKAITAGLLFAGGDMSAQLIERFVDFNLPTL